MVVRQIFGAAVLVAQALSSVPEQRSAREYAIKGWQALEGNHLAEAEGLLLQAVRLDRRQADYPAALGALCAREARWLEAARYWARAVKLSPVNAEFRLGLARALQASDRDARALQALGYPMVPRALQAEWTFTRAFSLFRMGRYRAALRDFQSVSSDPGLRAPASFFIGNLYLAQDQFQQAAVYFGQAMQLGDRPQNRAFNAYAYDYGLALYHLRQFAAAADAFRQSIDRYAEDPLPWLWLGRSKEELGAHAEAIAALEESIRVRPDFRLSYYQLARLQYQFGDKQRAVELFAKVNQMKQSERDADERLASRPKLGSEP